MRSRARSLVSHLHRFSLSATARVPPPPRALEPDRSSPTPTMSVRAGTLGSCLHHVNLCPTARLPPPRINSSATACVPPPPCPLEPDRSSPASTSSSSPIAPLTPTTAFRARPLFSHPTVSIQAQSPVSHLHHVLSSPTALLTPNRVNSSLIARVPPPPCPVEPDSSSPISTRPLLEPDRSSPAQTVSIQSPPLVSHLAVSIQAQLLVSHPTTLRSVMESAKPLTQQCCHRRNDVGDTTTTVTVLRWRK